MAISLSLHGNAVHSNALTSGISSSDPSEVLLPCRSDPAPEYRAFDFHIDVIKWIHDRLHPVLVHFDEKLFDCFLSLRCSRIRSDGSARPASIGSSWLERLV
jgi:hypothetical protein